MRDHIIAKDKVPLLAEHFINTAREIFETTKPSAEKKSLLSHTWLTSSSIHYEHNMDGDYFYTC